MICRSLVKDLTTHFEGQIAVITGITINTDRQLFQCLQGGGVWEILKERGRLCSFDLLSFSAANDFQAKNYSSSGTRYEPAGDLF